MSQKTNKIVKWDLSLKGFPKTLYIEGLHDDYEGFRILIKGGNPSKLYRINFGTYYLGYRNFDESERLKSLHLFPCDCREWSLFKTKDSDFIDWLVDESKGIQSKDEITHYFIVTPNDMVEILCLSEPTIEEL